MRAKVSLLKALLSNDDIEAKLGSGIAAGLDKFSSDDVEQTLHDFQYGASAIGPNYGEGRRLTLKLSSRWESLNTATADWETRFPNLVLESLSIDLVPGSAVSAPYLQISTIVLRRDRELIQDEKPRSQEAKKSRTTNNLAPSVASHDS